MLSIYFIEYSNLVNWIEFALKHPRMTEEELAQYKAQEVLTTTCDDNMVKIVSFFRTKFLVVYLQADSDVTLSFNNAIYLLSRSGKVNTNFVYLEIQKRQLHLP